MPIPPSICVLMKSPQHTQTLCSAKKTNFNKLERSQDRVIKIIKPTGLTLQKNILYIFIT